MIGTKKLCYFFLSVYVCAASAIVLNDPYPRKDKDKKIYYTSFNEQPKTLDPARSYSANEFQFIMQIYEPLLEYDYYLRPYQLIPLTAASFPEIRYLNKKGQSVAQEAQDIAFTVYTLHIQPGIFYQPHPALAKDEQGQYRYLQLAKQYISEKGIYQISDFKYTGTREVNADDYIYEIKRLASPQVSSPIYGMMSEYIDGFAEFAKSLPRPRKNAYVDLRRYPLAGVRKIDNYTYEIHIKGRYPQFIFWLAMPFFAPIPWEADRFYAQPGMQDKNLSFDWFPIGTGPFMLRENNPNRRMMMQRNPNYRSVFFPAHASKEDILAGYRHDIDKKLPGVDEIIYTLEQEFIPRWNKFLQGYYDLSSIASDSFNQAVQIQDDGKAVLTPFLAARHMRLVETNSLAVFYLGFNMLDPVVGGYSERAQKLRQAISMAINYEENINIFFNGRGIAAQGPIPPGIFGYHAGQEGINPYVYSWQDNKAVRRPISEAKRLLSEAGYPNGIDPKTGQALILHYDVPVSGGPDDKSSLDWMRKQFAKLGIDLDVRATLYNRFQDKMSRGNAQIFSWGWDADYPDPENFLFMLYGPNSKVKFGGENTTNYSNPQYDKLFEQMKNMPNDAHREKIIQQMTDIVRKEAPWVWGMNMQTLVIAQQWVSPVKPNTISLGQMKYADINIKQRNDDRVLWNQAILWPVVLFVLLIILAFLPLLYFYIQKEKNTARRIDDNLLI